VDRRLYRARHAGENCKNFLFLDTKLFINNNCNPPVIIDRLQKHITMIIDKPYFDHEKIPTTFQTPIVGYLLYRPTASKYTSLN